MLLTTSSLTLSHTCLLLLHYFNCDTLVSYCFIISIVTHLSLTASSFQLSHTCLLHLHHLNCHAFVSYCFIISIVTHLSLTASSFQLSHICLLRLHHLKCNQNLQLQWSFRMFWNEYKRDRKNLICISYFEHKTNDGVWSKISFLVGP